MSGNVNFLSLSNGLVQLHFKNTVPRPQAFAPGWAPFKLVPLTAANYVMKVGYAVDLEHLGSGSLSLPTVGQSFPYLYD